MLTPAELAADLGISTRQVQRLVSAGMPVLPVCDPCRVKANFASRQHC